MDQERYKDVEGISPHVKRGRLSFSMETPLKNRSNLGLAFYRARKYWFRLIVCILCLLVLILLANITTAFLIAFMFLTLFMGFRGRISLTLSMLCLIACPLLLAFDHTEAAGTMGIWAFAFLAIGVLAEVVVFFEKSIGHRETNNTSRESSSEMARTGFWLGTGVRVEAINRAIGFIRDNLVSAVGYMIVATFAANFLNYLFNVTAGRMLGPDDYGEFAALMSIFIIVTVPTNSLQAMLAKKIAEYRIHGSTDDIKDITLKGLYICLIAAAVVFLFSFLLSNQIASFLHIGESTSVIACGIAVGLALFLPAYFGVMQGFQWFIWLGSLVFFYSAGRYIFGSFFIKIGWGVPGAMLGGALGCILVIAAATYRIRRVLTQERISRNIRLRELGRSFLPFILANGIIFLLVSIDAVIVKRNFSSTLAGEYACAAFLGKIILYFPSSVGIVLFPKIVEAYVEKRDTRGLLVKGILIVMAGSLLISVLFIFFPRFIINLLYGEEYAGAASILWMFSISMTAYTVAGMFVYYFLATEKSRYLLIVLIVCASIGLLLMYFAATTSFQVVLFQFIAGVLFITASIFKVVSEARCEILR